MKQGRRKPLRPVEKERDVFKKVRNLLELQGFMVIRIQQGLGCHKGMSDLIAVRDGRVFFVECKSSRGEQSNRQKEFQETLEAHGGEYVLVRSADDLVRYLRRAGLARIGMVG